MITVGFIQNTEYDEYINDDFEPDYRTVAWFKNKCTLLKMRDSDTSVSVEREQDVLVNSNDSRLTVLSMGCSRRLASETTRSTRSSRSTLSTRTTSTIMCFSSPRCASS